MVPRFNLGNLASQGSWGQTTADMGGQLPQMPMLPGGEMPQMPMLPGGEMPQMPGGLFGNLPPNVGGLLGMVNPGANFPLYGNSTPGRVGAPPAPPEAPRRFGKGRRIGRWRKT
jgi:hypothetical protein